MAHNHIRHKNEFSQLRGLISSYVLFVPYVLYVALFVA